MEVLKITKNEYEKEVLQSDKPVLIDFNANWCGPCRMQAPILEDIAKENATVKIVSINIDEEEDLATQYNVYSIPCLVLIKNGEEVKRNVGFLSKEQVEKLIEE